MEIDFKIPVHYVKRKNKNELSLPQYRSEFMRDRDRILYCTAMRRLDGKTQIYTTGLDDHKKNRLTHTLEVAQISRTLASALGLNTDLAEAIALGHDLGHTPFGHVGERILHEIMIPNSRYIESPLHGKSEREIIRQIAKEEHCSLDTLNYNVMFGFKHNIQSVRVAAILEDSYRDNENKNVGLNLTNYTLWGMMHHTHLYYKDSEADRRYPNYQSELGPLLEVSEGSGAWSFEAYIVNIADEIAQWHHDLEDALRGDALSIESTCRVIRSALKNRINEQEKNLLKEYEKKITITRRMLADISHIVVNALVTDVKTVSEKNLDKIKKELRKKYSEDISCNPIEELYKNYKEQHLSIKKNKVINFSDEIDMDEIKDKIVNAVHHSRSVERMNVKGNYIVRKLFEAYYCHPDQLPDGPILHYMVGIGKMKDLDELDRIGSGEMRKRFSKELDKAGTKEKIFLMRRICDHIASATDRYAIEEYEHLYG